MNPSTSFKVAANFPVGHFTTNPPLKENLEKYPPTSANSTPLQLTTREYECMNERTSKLKDAQKRRRLLFGTKLKGGV